MATSPIIFVASFLAILFNAAHVESRSHWYTLFVFGDSYADTGNTPKIDLSSESRQWYTPYGVNRAVYGRPSGRFSDGFLETDFIARMLGVTRQAPSTYKDRSDYGNAAGAGMNFAHGGAGVFKEPSLSKQIHYFQKAESERSWHLDIMESVALIAISGNYYERAANMNNPEEMTAIIDQVTTEIAKGVKRLLKTGVSKVLVNNMHPVGCTPRQTRPVNYTKCDGNGNTFAESHNTELSKKLNVARNSDTVYIVDLNRAFSSIINPQDPSTSPERANEFTHKLKPCCRSYEPNGYCGQVDDDEEPQYDVCKNPEQHFFWDDMHPSQAGWDVVMGQLESDIKDFLDISD